MTLASPEILTRRSLDPVVGRAVEHETNMKLTVVMVNTWRTQIAIVHENSFLPYTRRTVQIELTQEQVAALAPQKLGVNCGKDVHEEMGEVWLEASTPNDRISDSRP